MDNLPTKEEWENSPEGERFRADRDVSLIVEATMSYILSRKIAGSVRYINNRLGFEVEIGGRLFRFGEVGQ